MAKPASPRLLARRDLEPPQDRRNLCRTPDHHHHPRQWGKPSHYVGIFSDVTIQKIQAQHLDQIAHYDPLSGLPNRRLLADRLRQAMARARREGTRVAVAYMDLDGFKAVNDKHGHQLGDRLLVAVGRRMQQLVREFDTVCRLGGDEFVVVIGDVRQSDECLPLIARLLAAVAEPVFVDNTRLCVTGSIGVSFYPLDEDIDADQLMRQADQAMYRAKGLGKNRYCVFESAEHR
ncbi:diguanylate cyclase domain-containing protein [Massilia aerilata]|uniref:Diguanylate cyclase domain-containing protein n=1 Tax=Massilia aerilata TaxID=453817 RepID=A0ABW0RWL3_9BURK